MTNISSFTPESPKFVSLEEKVLKLFPDLPIKIWDLHEKINELKDFEEWTEWRKQLDAMMKNFFSRLNEWYDCEHFMTWVAERVKRCINLDLIMDYESYLVGGLGKLERILWEYISKQKENTDVLNKYFQKFQEEKEELIRIHMMKVRKSFWIERKTTTSVKKAKQRSIKDIMALVFKPSKI